MQIQELEVSVRSRDSMALLERQMQVAGNTMAHVHVTLQSQVGSYNQEWQGEAQHSAKSWIKLVFCDICSEVSSTPVMYFRTRMSTPGIQTEQRRLDIERIMLAKDCREAKNNTSIMDGYYTSMLRSENVCHVQLATVMCMTVQVGCPSKPC